jgi:hypothetical protein
VLVECQPGLVQLLSRCAGIDQLVPAGQPLPPFHVHAPLLGLPRIFGTTLATVPAQVPYLFAAAALIAHWREQLAHLDGFRIGINWCGRPDNPAESLRAIPLTCFEPLARLPGVRLVSLQKGPGANQLNELGARFPVIDLGADLDTTAGAFMDTAALMMSLDLVITSDTSIAHLAGALGVPVWVALPFGSEWRWLLDRADSPWYPTMRLFRQTTWGDWGGVFRQLAAAVQAVIKTPPSALND